MNDVRYMLVALEEVGQRLDNYLLRLLKGVPKSHIYRIIRGGEVRVNSKRAKVSQRLCAGDSIRVPPIRLAAEKNVYVGSKWSARLEDCILYEDDALLVVNKPAGIAVHGGSGLSFGVIEALRKLRTDLPYLELVHRLDKETSGCLLLAKKRSMLRAIQAMLADRSIKKTYVALWSLPWVGPTKVLVDIALQKNILASGERRVIVHPAGKSSQTSFKLIENYLQACFVEASPHTGRTHQIRVHSLHQMHPIIGDEKYGARDLCDHGTFVPERLYLHARAVDFALNGRNYHFQAELDPIFTAALDQLRQQNHDRSA